jgi:alpha-glucuronidase
MLIALLLTPFLRLAAAENGLAAWLRYAPLENPGRYESSLPSTIVALNANTSSPIYTTGIELQKGIFSISTKKTILRHNKQAAASSLVVGTIAEYTKAYGALHSPPDLIEDGFWLDTRSSPMQILALNERGALYGAFEYLSMLAQGNASKVAYVTNPSAPIRWVNQWDNMDGSITRGFGGASTFFSDGAVLQNLTRAAEYARLLASIRLNAVVVNNVNANSTLLSTVNIAGLGRIADVMRPYGIQIGISLHFASPTEAVANSAVGNLTTYDPIDSAVISWWATITQQLYNTVPNLAGYLVKADSEGQAGPLAYNRTLAQGANLFAQALEPYGGILMFRAFVYNLLNESDWRADRANAAVEFFQPLDGEFMNNFVIRIKYGPIDFQVREPASPLFANLLHTNVAIELEVAQEYLGQQCHLVYLPPLWKTVLDFDLRVNSKPSLVRDIATGMHFGRPLGGSAAVVNVGTNTTWLGSHLAMSNLYAYGRLAWDASQSPEPILQDWIRLTFGLDPSVLNTITQMSMDSWPAYENYSGNLGIQTLTDILYTHYGSNPASQEQNGYGQWTRADSTSVGMDRTVSNGTGNSGKYPPEIHAMYESPATTPDNLLLWFHHVPWTHRLKSGVSIIQHFYNAHYTGAASAQTFVPLWKTLIHKIDPERYAAILFRQEYQAGHAIVWRDSVNEYYYNMTSIPDALGRVNHHPWRIEAESMTLHGYRVSGVALNETASNRSAIMTVSNSTVGTASHTIAFPSGTYDIGVNYFDLYGGVSNYTLFLGGRVLGVGWGMRR